MVSNVMYSCGLRGYSRNLTVVVAHGSGTPAYLSEDITGHLYVQTSIWSCDHLDAVVSWHANCRRQHPECAKTLSGSQEFDVTNVPLPTRCIEVKVDHTSNPPSYTYVLRETAGQLGKYVTLSHRWGPDAESCKTTKATFACRKGECTHDACRLSPISRLFRDAGMLSAGIGVKYIWIDSLCIVQDDEDDWDRESRLMGEYYQHSWLTICATTLATTGGLFGPISDEYHPRVTRLPYRSRRHGTQEGWFYVQYMENAFLSGDYQKNIKRSSLLKRGWVFQEWMMSRRILTFSGQGGLFVQCQREAPHSLHGDTVNGQSSSSETNYENDLFENKTPSASWISIVETYSGLELTRLTRDRLIALSGLAREFGRTARSETKYLSGLWGRQCEGLLWEQSTPGDRVRVRGIATWSWASMAIPMKDDDGMTRHDDQGQEILSGMPVRWPSESGSAMIVVCQWKAETEIVREDATAITISPWMDTYDRPDRFFKLNLIGKLLPIQIHGSFQQYKDAAIISALTDNDPDFCRDTWRTVTVSSEPDLISGWASLEHPDYQSDEHVLGCTSIYALVVMKSRKRASGWSLGLTDGWLGRQPILAVLFLKIASEESSDSLYERVGCGRLFGTEVNKMFRDAENQDIWLV